MPNGPYVLRSPPNLFDNHRKVENVRDSKQAKFGELTFELDFVHSVRVTCGGHESGTYLTSRTRPFGENPAFASLRG